jgi:hypothetical protein
MDGSWASSREKTAGRDRLRACRADLPAVRIGMRGDVRSMTSPPRTTYLSCQILSRLCSPCEVCGVYGDPRHVVETGRLDHYGALVTETKCYCGRDCPVCKENK